MIPELLAPVRDRVSFTAAVNAGANSVYFGLGRLNMRANSKGIMPEELGEIVEMAHQKGVKVYVTVNSIIYQDELGSLDELLVLLRDAGVDAIICWDFAVIQRAKALGMEFHISTQASIANSEAAQFFKDLGASRVVLARELTLEQIADVKSKCDIELEVFAHGAMCVSVSGRCFMSQSIFNRSANRGDCLQPCRREYRITDVETQEELVVGDNYVLSPKDLCTLPILDKLVAAGVTALKIEGRSRSPEYIATVTNAYRQALDAIAENQFDDELKQELMAKLQSVYNRGFSNGFYLGVPGPHDWTDRAANQATHQKLQVGKVLNFYSKINVAYVRVENCSIAVGDTIQIHGPTSGVVECKLESLRDEDGNPLATADKTTATFPVPATVRSGDQVYKIVPVE